MSSREVATIGRAPERVAGQTAYCMNWKTLTRRQAIALVCIFSNVLALASFGVVFWIDAADYANLALAMVRPGGLHAFYVGVGAWTFSHLQPGLPLLAIALQALPETWQWPVLAGAQHALAAGAVFVFFSTLDRFWPSRWHVAGAFFLCFLPFYQASHSSFMTESLTSSLLLFGLAQGIALAREPAMSLRRMAWLLALIFLATQLRSYAGLVLAGAVLPALSIHRALVSRYSIACALTLAVAGIAFPAYRYAKTGAFWLPMPGLNSVIAGWWVNPVPSPRALEDLAAFPTPPHLQPARLVGKGLSYDDALALGRYWKQQGWDDLRIARTGQAMGEILSGDGAMVQAGRASLAAVSSGSLLIFCAWPSERIVFPGYTAQRLCEHQQRTYLLQSWIDGTAKIPLFRSFFLSAPGAESFAFHQEAKSQVAAALRPHLAELLPGLQDPFSFGRLPPDALLLAALASLVFLMFGEPAIAFIGAWLFAINFAVAFSVPVGNPRYAYALVPVYVGLCCVAAARLSRAGRNRKSA